ncbi:TAXI family TRAP transporter solute-binding subunit [Azospirillum sp. ST 5-10]|uniref:TAXI family TRAP transporter solute-binding subunit n=1 Tax=unclassified Azospirillum TaxID=2630922 RepID=UPI003F4A3759
MMTNVKKALGVAALAVAMLTGTAVAQTKDMRLTMAGASPGGLWSLLGVGVDRAVKESFPNSTVTYQTSGGGVANVVLLEQKRADIGLVHNAELRLALQGEAPFRQKSTGLVAIASMYDWAPMQFVVAKDFAERYGLKTIEDLAAKKPPIRLVLNRRGNISQMVAEKMLAANGISAGDIEKWGGAVVLAGSEEQADLIRDGRVDALFNSLFVGQRSLIEVGQHMNVVMLPAGDATIAKVAESMGVTKFTIPANSYEFQKEPVQTASLGALLVADQAMPEDTAYALAKALVENVGQITSVHPAMKALTPEFMTKQDVLPFHPGAEKLFKEKGLM